MTRSGTVSARKALGSTRGSALLEMIIGLAITMMLFLAVTSSVNAMAGDGLISTSAMINAGLVAGAVLLAAGLGTYVFLLWKRVSGVQAAEAETAAREAKAASVQHL
ncbi:hypothetical protein [Arthrobacter sp. zg-Y1110]|uniref:hypothetical protein n=1 Tax=Arthrobacter sp. zg-Y1110 TaxID=2886932 RepID=UPI001D147ADC|nr:hypothetical protein [Arthrobacter sp. zg-Y1110]MCC3292951.1 hypothetical protein [Arthrobacter sp. zg-Y1110]UWX86890.1 hypothetical protein N2K99_18780 [Arthrobacter sp. zg-Y1110]